MGNRPTRGGTALNIAAYWNHPEVAKILLDRGADVNSRGMWDWTPLQTAEYYKHTTIVQMIKEASEKRGRDITPAVEWIKSNKNKITEQQIFDTLRSKGWSEDEIKDALNQAKEKYK